MLQDWQIKLSEYFSKQEGQNYPCSNQNVCNGFFTPRRELWENFIEKNKENIIWIRKESVCFKNGEYWYYYRNINDFTCRGKRFYRIKIDINFDKKNIDEKILPYCGFYCKELEWLE